MAISTISLNKSSSDIALSTLSPVDTESKNILKQITSQQQNLNRLASDSEMSAEEKAKKRQEIQKQIAELNKKLRMLRMEKKEEAKEVEKEQEQKKVLREKQEKEISGEEDKEADSVETIKEQQKKANISPQNVKTILEAQNTLHKERIWQNMEQKQEAMENIMQAEIASDKLYGADTTVKQKKLSDLIKEKPFELETGEQQKANKVFRTSAGKMTVKQVKK